MFNQIKSDGLTLSCQKDKPISICMGLGWYFHHFQILIYISIAISEDPDQTPHNSVSEMGLHCLPMSRKRVLSLYGLI